MKGHDLLSAVSPAGPASTNLEHLQQITTPSSSDKTHDLLLSDENVHQLLPDELWLRLQHIQQQEKGSCNRFLCEARHKERSRMRGVGYLPHAPENALAMLLHALQALLAHLVPPFRLVLR